MTCGICNPQGFREAWQASHHIQGKSPRVWGYAVAADACSIAAQVRTLLYHGAEQVLADLPIGQVRNRPGFRTLTDPVYLRSGDTLLVTDNCAFGSKPQLTTRIEEELKERGIAVWEVTAQDD